MFLVNPERDSNAPMGKVLLVGPTEEYAKHVRPLVKSLDPQNRVMVRGMPSWLKEIAENRLTLGGPPSGSRRDVSWSVGTMAYHAVNLLSRSDPMIRRRKLTSDGIRKVYTAIKNNRVGDRQLTEHPALVSWARSLPPHKQAVQLIPYAPLLAACSLAICPADKRYGYDHIIVDEAQDISPIEWRIISLFNRGRWTLVGDMNQRRSDWSYQSWDALASRIGIADPDGHFAPEDFQRGYRSTLPIMRFANRLLGDAASPIDCLQREGPEPLVMRRIAGDLFVATIMSAETLASRHPQGTTAIISVSPGKIIGVLRSSGWVGVPEAARTWTKGGVRLTIVTPDDCRGLEFDGVLVVEPDDFPKNRDRLGPLYTALTRANRELNIIHSKPLPPPLRQRAPA